MGTYAHGSNISYADYLTAESLARDVANSAERAGRRVSLEISRSTRTLVASQEALARHGFAEVQARVDEGFDRIETRLDDVGLKLDELGATFQWGFSEILAQMDRMNGTLVELLAVARTPITTAASELFGIARDAFRRRLYPEALAAVDGAIAKYAIEWRFHHFRGVLCLGFARCDRALVDLAAAESSFLAAARYARTDSPIDAGFSMLLAGRAAYCRGAFREAEKHTEEATKLLPKAGEAYFQRAKIQMASEIYCFPLGVAYLRRAVSIDPVYLLRAAADPDFTRHGEKFEAALVDWKKEVVSRATRSIGPDPAEDLRQHDKDLNQRVRWQGAEACAESRAELVKQIERLSSCPPFQLPQHVRRELAALGDVSEERSLLDLLDVEPRIDAIRIRVRGQISSAWSWVDNAREDLDDANSALTDHQVDIGRARARVALVERLRPTVVLGTAGIVLGLTLAAGFLLATPWVVAVATCCGLIGWQSGVRVRRALLESAIRKIDAASVLEGAGSEFAVLWTLSTTDPERTVREVKVFGRRVARAVCEVAGRRWN